MSHSTGPGNWLCSPHWGCKDAAEGAVIVAASQDYRHRTPAQAEKEHHEKAEKHCASLGINTQAQRREHLRKALAKFPVMQAYATREPGEDYEEDQQ